MELTSDPWVKIEAKIQNKGQNISVTFMPNDPPKVPGVYCVVRKNFEIDAPFYIGEARNLERRLRFLFRCGLSNNPHPCHGAYKIAFNVFPAPEVFCADFFVLYLSTVGMRGRIEIEEELQKKYRTNKKVFYKSFRKGHGEAEST
jgi:hypothetical protein